MTFSLVFITYATAAHRTWAIFYLPDLTFITQEQPDATDTEDKVRVRMLISHALSSHAPFPTIHVFTNPEPLQLHPWFYEGFVT